MATAVASMQPVVVVGGGVMGASAAYQLALRGRRCIVLEAGTLAHGASGNAAGILGPPRDSPAPGGAGEAWHQMRRKTFEMHQQLATTLPEQSGVDYGWHVTAGIGVAVTAQEERQARRELAAMRELGIPGVAWLSAADIRAATEVYDGPGIRGGVLSDDPAGGGAQVEPSLFTAALMAAAQNLAGSELREHCKVVGLLDDAAAVRGVVLDSGEEVLGDAVVLAMGPWAAAAAPWLGGGVQV
jgi:glycine/D-amino acid oxidase-like deaminating enzyme